MEAHPRAMEAHPEGFEASPGAVKTHRVLWVDTAGLNLMHFTEGN
jgi:hypothetical protein